KRVAGVEQDFQEGLITVDERKRLSNEIWLETTDTIAELTWNNLKPESVIRTIIDSEGARAGKEQLKQLSAMRGLILDPLGKIVELPIKSNFREGLSIFEYVSSARGSRKGLTDSALKTANAGYLTRRLVDVSHDVIIGVKDCGTKDGILITDKDLGRTASFEARLIGRIAAEKIISKTTRKEIVKQGEEITEAKAKQAVLEGVTQALVRSAITCKLEYGVCAACYGWDFSTKEKVASGVPVGVIAAQSIGEPGTQLTMRVRHFGGVVMSDVTQGLPRVEELFEMRTPKNLSPVSEITGKVNIETTEEGYIVRVKSSRSKPVDEKEYFVPMASTLNVADGDEILSGTPLAEGYLDPKEIIKIKGLVEGQRYIITESQKVY
ncbi:MAG: DNA-directed RNA polymerase subunit beta', partial [bacterium]|nr:DNA-directed RNA polymerase subunit beta' [bacterium]